MHDFVCNQAYSTALRQLLFYSVCFKCFWGVEHFYGHVQHLSYVVAVAHCRKEQDVLPLKAVFLKDFVGNLFNAFVQYRKQRFRKLPFFIGRAAKINLFAILDNVHEGLIQELRLQSVFPIVIFRYVLGVIPCQVAAVKIICRYEANRAGVFSICGLQYFVNFIW